MKRLAWSVVLVVGCGGGSVMQGDDAPLDAAGSGSNMGSGSGSGSSSGTLTALQTCVSETNRDRALNGKPPLGESAALETYAGTGAEYDFSHNPHDHFSSTQGGGISFAENECPQQGNWNLSFGGGDVTQTVIACVAAFYAEGPDTGDGQQHGHYINMMSDNAELGCGIYVETSTQKVTIVQDYGP